VFAAAGAPSAQAADGTSSCGSSASGGTSGGGGGGSVSGSTVTMWEMLTVKSQASLCPSGTSNSGGGDYQPPQCWWGPEFDPQGLADDIGQLEGGSADDTYVTLTDEYAHGGTGMTDFTAGYKSTDGPPWELFNVGATPPGEWWGLIWSDTITEQGIEDCTAIDNKHSPEDWYWVPDQTAAPDPGDAPVLDPYELALYIEGKVNIQSLPIQTSPSLATTDATVGLPTWVWADDANTTVTDDICTAPQYGNICVTMTATAQSFTVTSNDSGAQIFGPCTRNAGGDIGTPYKDGDTGNPPCGVTFSQPGNWNLDMLTTWNIAITYAGGELDQQIQTDTAVPATVQEVQAINNGQPAA
jgi:enoyl reductase